MFDDDRLQHKDYAHWVKLSFPVGTGLISFSTLRFMTWKKRTVLSGTILRVAQHLVFRVENFNMF
jgi:hypothetical protein